MGDSFDTAEESEDLRRETAFLADTAPKLAEDLLAAARVSRAGRTDADARAADEIGLTWARGWTVLDAVVYAMEQSAALLHQRSGVGDSHAATREALLLLQCSGTMIFREIQELLRSGYLSGAAARWRALQETAVTAVAIAENGPRIARRYLDHGIVTQLTRLEKFYQQPHPGAPAAEERAKRMALVEELIAAHTLSDESIGFMKPYAWATPLMPRRKDGKFREPTFTLLEDATEQTGMRLLIQSGAHGHVHADAGAVRTAVLRDGTDLLTGPRTDEVPTVAVPALRSAALIAGATHLGYEPVLNEFGRLAALTGAAIVNLAMKGADEFKAVDPSSQPLF